jgi:hypothetical protein
MCQQWFSVIGLVFDVVGFLIIAFEWRHSYWQSVSLRQDDVDRDYLRADQGSDALRDRDVAEASMWRNTQRENLKDNAYRARLFWVGVLLVVLGFVGQVAGSWPYGIGGIKSC